MIFLKFIMGSITFSLKFFGVAHKILKFLLKIYFWIEKIKKVFYFKLTHELLINFINFYIYILLNKRLYPNLI